MYKGTKLEKTSVFVDPGAIGEIRPPWGSFAKDAQMLFVWLPMQTTGNCGQAGSGPTAVR